MLVIYPIFSSVLLSMIIGFALICFGISAISMGFIFRNNFNNVYSYLSVTIGFISVLFGKLFVFFVDALTFLVSLQFYIVGFLLMVYGFMGIILLDDKKYTVRSVLILILGILTVVLAVFAASQPVLIAIIIGVALMIEGVFVLVMDRSMTLIEKYG